MPDRPPVFRPPGWRQRPAWERSIGQQGQEHPLPKNWPKVRAAVLADEPLCRACRAAGRVTAATEVDHVVPRSQGGATERTNLAAICGPCHRAKTQREAREARARMRPGG